MMFIDVSRLSHSTQVQVLYIINLPSAVELIKHQLVNHWIILWGGGQMLLRCIYELCPFPMHINVDVMIQLVRLMLDSVCCFSVICLGQCVITVVIMWYLLWSYKICYLLSQDFVVCWNVIEIYNNIQCVQSTYYIFCEMWVWSYVIC